MQTSNLNLIEALEYELKKPLPGLDAQLQMVPHVRRNDVLTAPNGMRKGGVLALLYEHQQHLMIVFIERSVDGGVHSGQISFPGGKYEDNDRDLITTALREASEEIGVDIKKIKVIGNLSVVNVLASNFTVLPTVAYCTEKPEFNLNPLEVASLIEMPLNHFLNDFNKGLGFVEVKGMELEVPVFKTGKHQIWGATAMILNELVYVLKKINGGKVL